MYIYNTRVIIDFVGGQEHVISGSPVRRVLFSSSLVWLRLLDSSILQVPIFYY